MCSLSKDSNSEGEDADTDSLVDDDTEQWRSSSHNIARDAEAPAQQPSGPSVNSEDENDDGRRRKRRRLSHALGAYQVFEPWRKCFQQVGGYEDIKRLKYNIHLTFA